MPIYFKKIPRGKSLRIIMYEYFPGILGMLGVFGIFDIFWYFWFSVWDFSMTCTIFFRVICPSCFYSGTAYFRCYSSYLPLVFVFRYCILPLLFELFAPRVCIQVLHITVVIRVICPSCFYSGTAYYRCYNSLCK